MQWDGKREGGRENDVSLQKKKCNEVRNGRKTLGEGGVMAPLVRQKAT